MSKSTKPRARIALPNAKGVFVEREIANDGEDDGTLTHCPETGISLDGIDCRKRALSLYPSIEAHAVPQNEAGRRFQLLMDEHARRQQ
jgi:hypothetical protein